jgi:hypothetical protein
MKRILPLVCLCFLVAACNRPMLQPPVTQTPPAKPGTDTGAALSESRPVPSLKSTYTSDAHKIAATSTNLPINSPTPDPIPTLKLSSTPSPYLTPAWCPVEHVTPTNTGKLSVAYVSNGHLWLWNEGEGAKRLPTSSSIKQVSISDDGRIIAFTRQLDEYHEELWGVNADGDDEHLLVSAEDLARLDGTPDALGIIPWGIQWEPGTHHLIFFTYPIFHALWVYEPSTPWMVDADNGNITAAPYHGGAIVYSPDGNHVAIFDSRQINLSRTDGSDRRERILPSYHGIGLGESFYNPIPAWSEDSSSILVGLPDQTDIFSSNSTVTGWRVPVAGTPEKIGQWKAFAPSVSFSPDQNFMAYWPSPEGYANIRELHLSRLGLNQTETTPDVIYLRGELIDVLAWSPDSQHFIFQMGDPGQQTQFYFIGDICQRPVKLTNLAVGGYFTLNAGGNIVTWVDAYRYLLWVGIPDDNNQWELHLGEIGQDKTEVLGVITSYDWTTIP